MVSSYALRQDGRPRASNPFIVLQPPAADRTDLAMIRVALLDHHPVVLTGMIRLLEPAPDMEVLARPRLAREARRRPGRGLRPGA
jgi:hypothetical protein